MLPPAEAEVLERAGGAVVAAEATGRIAYFSTGAEAMFGRRAADVVGQPLTLLMPPRMHAAHRAGIQRYLRTHESRLLGRPVRVPALRADGTEFEVDLQLRMFRRPDGSDLIIAALQEARPGARPPDLLEIESGLQRRAYDLV